MNNINICVLIVTYGKRWHLLRRVIDSVLLSGLDKIIVVDNDSSDDVAELCKSEFFDKVHVISMKTNLGSAGGFHVAFKEVMQQDVDFVLLLDDDNVVQENAVNNLYKCFISKSKYSDESKLAIIGYRDIKFSGSIDSISIENSTRIENSFMGFHIADIPKKISKRIFTINNHFLKREKNPSLIFAPWSGLFFKTELIKKFGLPMSELYLYADDYEYTRRITRDGGVICLCENAVIDDIDLSWNSRGKLNNSFDILLEGKDDFRAYYSTRNNGFLEYHQKGKNLIRLINKLLFFTILILRGLMNKRADRLMLLLKAFSDGKNKKLGIDNQYKL